MVKEMEREYPATPQSNPHLELDYILETEIGQFGKYQIKMLGLVVIVTIFSSWNSEYIFTTGRINTRCRIPECESFTTDVDFNTPWIHNAIPNTTEGFEHCSRYAPNGHYTNETWSNSTCSVEAFDQQSIIPCEEYIYESKESVVYDYNLGCDEWRRTVIGSVRKLGNVIASPLVGYVSDRWGRCKAMIITSINTAILGTVRAWAPNYGSFFALELLESILGAYSFHCAHILLMELVGPRFRTYVGGINNSFYSIGQMLLGFTAWYTPDWKTLTLVLFLPQLICIAYLWLLSESVRWYMSKGRYEDAERVLKKVAKVNGKILSSETLEALKRNVDIKKGEEIVSKTEPMLIVVVFQHKRILLRCFITSVWWIAAIMTYFGLSINSVNLAGNKYLNYSILAAIEIPGVWTSILLMRKIGRKPVLIASFWLGAICQIGYMVLSNERTVVALILYLIAKYSAAMVMNTMYIYTAELYPTRHRHRLFAFSSMVGHIGGILAPLTPALSSEIWVNLPFAIFASLSLLSGLLTFLTPETLGTVLPDSMKAASNLGQNEENSENASSFVNK